MTEEREPLHDIRTTRDLLRLFLRRTDPLNLRLAIEERFITSERYEDNEERFSLQNELDRTVEPERDIIEAEAQHEGCGCWWWWKSVFAVVKANKVAIDLD